MQAFKKMKRARAFLYDEAKFRKPESCCAMKQGIEPLGSFLKNKNREEKFKWTMIYDNSESNKWAPILFIERQKVERFANKRASSFNASSRTLTSTGRIPQL